MKLEVRTKTMKMSKRQKAVKVRNQHEMLNQIEKMNNSQQMLSMNLIRFELQKSESEFVSKNLSAIGNYL